MSFDPSKYTKSKWLRGSDLEPGQPVMATIKTAYEHTFESSSETKPALDFYDLGQSMTLNKTQCMAMIQLFGNDPAQWIDKQINLMAVPSNYQGKPTILITKAGGGQQSNPQPPAAPSPEANPQPPMHNNMAFQGDPAAEVRFG